MGAAIIGGVLRTMPSATLTGLDPDLARVRTLLPADALVKLYDDPSALAGLRPDLIILAVKPQSFSALDDRVMALIRAAPTVSIMAGINLQRLAAEVGTSSVIRVMPNLPALVGKGMSLGCTINVLSPDLQRLIEAVFGAVGHFEWAPDEQSFERANPVFSCGPGFIFSIAEHMQRAATAQGVPELLAKVLVQQTILGSAIMLSSDSRDAAALKRAVSSPGGTTLAGLSVLEGENAFPRLIAETLQAAYERAFELSTNSAGSKPA